MQFCCICLQVKMPTSARDLSGDPSNATTIVAESVMKTVKREPPFDDPFSLMKASVRRTSPITVLMLFAAVTVVKAPT
jgi:hypothetical protein